LPLGQIYYNYYNNHYYYYNNHNDYYNNQKFDDIEFLCYGFLLVFNSDYSTRHSYSQYSYLAEVA